MRVAIEKGHIFSFILWGPPGVGKTTLAKIYAKSLGADLHELSAVSAGKDDIRELVKLGMATAARSRSAVQSHTHRALEAGATVAEVEHAVLLGITTVGFPTMMAALSWVRSAVADHED